MSVPSAAPAQIGFSPDGRFPLVTEKATSRIDVFPVERDGYTAPPIWNESAGQTPFAFGFGKRDQVFVSEVFGGADDAGASARGRGRGTIPGASPARAVALAVRVAEREEVP